VPRSGADLREDERRDDRGDDPEAHFREPEDRVGPRDCDVGTRNQSRASAQGEAVHAADDRRRAGVDRLEHAVELHRVLDVLVVREVDRSPLPFDVGSRAERGALALEEDSTSVADVGERLGQLRDERGIEGVAALRLRQRHAEHVPVPLHLQRSHRRGA
jgi:hypothetical protein